MSEIKVNSIKGVGASSAAITVNNTDGTCTANLTNRTNKNLVINGAMLVAQRGTTNTNEGYRTVDRFRNAFNGTDEAPTQSQADVAAGTTPYTLGFRKSYKLTNGNQTGGAGATDYLGFEHHIEAQNVATSGWNFKSASSKLTLSFWIKSSVAQAFSGSIETPDSSPARFFKFTTASLSADTWTKVTLQIPGDSNLNVDMNTSSGLAIRLYGFIGTTYTSSDSDTETWVTGSNRYANTMTTTWYTTNDATLEITGVQLEVGSVATDFEHKSYGDTLWDCQRYCAQIGRADPGEDNYTLQGLQAYGTSEIFGTIGHWPRQMRAKPTVTLVGVIQYTNKAAGNVYSPSSGNYNRSSRNSVGTTALTFSGSLFIQGGYAAAFAGGQDGANYIQGEAEL